MANTKNTGPTQRKTIQSYGLTREVSTLEPGDVAFMKRYTDPNGDPGYFESWAPYKVSDSIDGLNWYAISNSLNAYVTLAIQLTSGEEIGDPRLTPMRYRDMMVDNILAAGGDLKTLRYIGTHGIINATTRDAARDAFREADRDLANPGSVEILSDYEGFAEATMCNPFTRGIQHILWEYKTSMGDARIKRFIFISEGLKSGEYTMTDFKPTLHLVTELWRPGDDGYPENTAS
ncbi:hypothetical protein HD806DRAFT_343344 [Xylariaceae sp. AK1471]|nr:hypothetical protein HD806DRAFT_343344 [Xylariaceae sp. AK1471]